MILLLFRILSYVLSLRTGAVVEKGNVKKNRGQAFCYRDPDTSLYPLPLRTGATREREKCEEKTGGKISSIRILILLFRILSYPLPLRTGAAREREK